MSFRKGPYIKYEQGATFIRCCEKCNRFVKADKKIFVNDCVGLKDQSNAVCSRCGRTKMIFEGYI